MLLRVVAAVDDPSLERRLAKVLRQPDLILEPAGGDDPWQSALRVGGDFIIVSLSLLPRPLHESVAALRRLPDAPSVVVMSEHEDPVERATLLAAGCDAVLHAGLPAEVLQDVLITLLLKRLAIGKQRLEQRALAEPRLVDFASSSALMQRFMETVGRVAKSDTALLVLGETGVGKERLARAIHLESARADGPFVPVNCGALPESLLESEIFGHEEGSFTGATRARRGCFELAHRGTIFLDEIAEMPIHLQVELLRVIQDHQIQRVGSEKAIAVDVRIMAATNRDLQAEVNANRFRKDLYYRLSVVTLTVPPLREHAGDIPALAACYVEHLRPRVGCRVTGITDDAMQALCRYQWPGNVRELINVIERAMLLCSGDRITVQDLPESISGARPPGRPQSETLSQPLALPDDMLHKPWQEVRRLILDQSERTYLAALLDQTGGRIAETAHRAGICPRALFEKMKRCGLRKEDYRPYRAQSRHSPPLRTQ